MEHRSKTLVILTPAFPGNESETYWVPSQQLMVKALRENFPHLNIIVLAILYPYRTGSYTWHGVQVISHDGMHRMGLRRIFLWRDIWKALNSIRSRHEIIGLLSFWCTEGAFLATRFGRRYRIPRVSWICGQDARKKNKWVRFIRPKSTELAAMSDFLSDEFYRSHRIRSEHIVYNAIDPDTFSPGSPPEKDIDILGVGSFEPLKQYDIFAEVISQLQQSFPNIKAIHCGMGREKKKVEALVLELDLTNNLELLGAKTHEEVLLLMRRAKILLHPSNYEGFSTVCLEALYAGAHVISFCYPLNNKVPHWHVVQTAGQMKDKVREILQDPHTDYSPVLLYSMDDSARAMMKLFGQEAAIFKRD